MGKDLGGIVRFALRIRWRRFVNTFVILGVLVPVAGLVLGAPSWFPAALVIGTIVYLLLQLGAVVWLVRLEVGDDPLPPQIDELTERLRLRRVQAADSEALVASIDDEVQRANGWPPQQRDAVAQLSAIDGDWAHVRQLVACDRETGRPAVFLSLDDHRRGPGAWHVGLWTVPERRGEGLATEALRAMLAVVHGSGLEDVMMGTAVDNHPMQRVIEAGGGIEDHRGVYPLPDGSVAESIWYRLPNPLLEG